MITYRLSPSSNLAEDRSTILGKLLFIAASSTDPVVTGLLRRAVGSTCEILHPEFDERGPRAMKHRRRTIPHRRIMDERTTSVRGVASADTSSCHLTRI